jgi:dolichyl-diphosphooligosaccharide--protein glycosyltransferase
MTSKPSTSTSLFGGTLYSLLSGLYIVGCLHVLYTACVAAYKIRLYAIEEYGRVIHEFDPYFNYRAAEYLWEHGASKFFHWFDYQSWYPLGRPVGTTIYPGMQFTSVWIKQFILTDWSINDICCFVPAWFGVSATLATAALCYTTVHSAQTTKRSKSILTDVPLVSSITNGVFLPIVQAFCKLLETLTGSTWGMATLKNPPALESAVFTACIMSIVPAHLLRSVGGGYDNESVATTAMQLTFWTWALTLSANSLTQATMLGVLSGICYFYMVASWGGYIFVINLIGLHALSVFLFRKLPWGHLYRSYTSFYVVGTVLAMQVPVVNWAPIKSIEQLGPFGLFVGFQVLQLMLILETNFHKVNKWKVRGMVVLAGVVVSMPIMYGLHTTGYFGPISSRVRGLFVEHTKTGNPLVDSVAEHQAASPEAYFQYLHEVVHLAPIGLAIVAVLGCTASSSFLIMYGITAYFFSHKMVRLILLTAPIASICGGIALGYAWAWAVGAIFGDARPSLDTFLGMEEDEEAEEKELAPTVQTKPIKAKDSKKKKKKLEKVPQATVGTVEDQQTGVVAKEKSGDPIWVRIVRLAVSAWVIQQMIPHVQAFQELAERMARQISHPTIITKGQNKQTGETVVVDDYRQAYFWLRDNTPEDARIMAWWDYGYQITGIGNRTTIADGNTWNHEHIALLGKTLTSPEKEAHRIARHLADYVLLWTGGGGDDVAKSPHLRRIANSVYKGLCSEPTCRSFGMTVSQVSGPRPILNA